MSKKSRLKLIKLIVRLKMTKLTTAQVIEKKEPSNLTSNVCSWKK